jgi:hypothetical protein
MTRKNVKLDEPVQQPFIQNLLQETSVTQPFDPFLTMQTKMMRSLGFCHRN